MKHTRTVLWIPIVFAVALGATERLRADVTLRYQTEFKPAAALQPMMEPLLKAMQSGAGSSISIRMKGNQGYTTAGSWSEIFDFAKGDVTLLDPAHKTFATLPLSQLMDKMMGAIPQTPQQPDAVKQILASMKSHVDSKVTGKTEEIQGVQAEEREVTFTLDIPIPAGAAPQIGPEMNIKMVIHIWTAKKEEVMRLPAVRELTGYQTWQRYIMNPAGIFEKVAGKMPGLTEVIGPLFEEMSKNQSVMLRTHMEIYMPFLAAVAKQAATQGQKFPAIDPDAPLLEMNQEVAELSNAPVDASLFEIPKGYSPAAVGDMVGEMVKAQQAAAPTAVPTAPAAGEAAPK
jgi:hypothetical protein